MKTIKKKCWPEYFEAILAGKKNYELRLNDFTIKEGDTLVLEEWDPKTKSYTGRSVQKKVTYVGKFKNLPFGQNLSARLARSKIDQSFWSEDEIKEKGLQILSIK